MRLLVATAGLLVTLAAAGQDPGDKAKEKSTKDEPPRAEAKAPISGEVRTTDPGKGDTRHDAKGKTHSDEARTKDPGKGDTRHDAKGKTHSDTQTTADPGKGDTRHAVGSAGADYTNSDGKVCGPAGTAKGAAAQDLDRHKNRFNAPGDGEIDTSVTLEELLQPGDDLDRFDQEKGARIVGLVVNVKEGSVETCNCRATAPVDRDTHIDLALSKGAGPTERVIVEVTPRLRAQMKAQGVDWSTDTLKSTGASGIMGKWVEVTGWLLFDTPHVGESENTHPGGAHNTRATAWEVHPVTSLKVVNEPSLSEAVRAPHALAGKQDDFRKLLTDARKDRLARRNAALLAKFDKEDLDEDEGSQGADEASKKTEAGKKD